MATGEGSSPRVTLPLASPRPCKDRASADCTGFIEPGRAPNSMRCLNCAAQRSTTVRRTHGFHKESSAIFRFMTQDDGGGLLVGRRTKRARS